MAYTSAYLDFYGFSGYDEERNQIIAAMDALYAGAESTARPMMDANITSAI